MRKIKLNYFILKGSLSQSSLGVFKKFKAQMAHFDMFDAKCIIFYESDSERFQDSVSSDNFEFIQLDTPLSIPILGKLFYLVKFYKSAISILKRDNPELVYIRGCRANPFIFLLSMRYPGRFVFEINTDENREFIANKRYIEFISNSIFQKPVLRLAAGCVAVTREIAERVVKIIDKPSVRVEAVSNGFDINSVSIRKDHPSPCKTGVELLFVAKVTGYHGLDRLLRGIQEYTGVIPVRLHVVGDGEALEENRKLSAELGISDRVIFHGRLFDNDLDELYSSCHIAFGSLGLHRINLSEASILKAREYAARGIPFVISYHDTDFSADNTFRDYILSIPSDDSNVDVSAVVSFAIKFYESSLSSANLRKLALEHVDMNIKMSKLQNFLLKLTPSSGGSSK